MGFKALPADSIVMIDSSHRRQEQYLADGIQVARDLADGRGDSAHIAALSDVIEFLRNQGKRHIVDEEASVFPRLAKHAECRTLTKELATEHREHEAFLEVVYKAYQSWGDAVPSARKAAVFVKHFNKMAAHYRAHIAREDDELVPAMRRFLGSSELGAITAEMLARRPHSGKRITGNGRRRLGGRRMRSAGRRVRIARR